MAVMTLAALAAALFAGLGPMPAERGLAPARAAEGELGARPQDGSGGETGLQQLGGGALLYVPRSYEPEKGAPLILMLHGAGGSAQHSLDLTRRFAEDHGFIVLAPKSRAPSWDIISNQSYGRDVEAIDGALKRAFASYRIDPNRVAVAGFSDGASYALSLGIINGELFTDIIAFSPGFIGPTNARGKPSIFISHGDRDEVLPIELCSRRIVPLLKRRGYSIHYREFSGGHTVPPEVARSAYEAFVT